MLVRTREAPSQLVGVEQGQEDFGLSCQNLSDTVWASPNGSLAYSSRHPPLALNSTDGPMRTGTDADTQR